MDKEKLIIQSWQANADNWTRLIESNGIESRRLATNKAIVEVVLSIKPLSVLDIGCGEGWLSKEFFENGISITGVDAIPELIAKASGKAKGDFYVASYEEIASGEISFPGTFDAVVINFALMGKESTENLLASLPKYISAGGKLFIQTLHPYNRKELNDYSNGWKDGSWNGLNEQFVLPYQWYFRTMEDWIQLLHDSGYDNIHTIETKHPLSGQLLSVIFQCNVK